MEHWPARGITAPAGAAVSGALLSFAMDRLL
jgi:hypothetical protein